jgi:hypothetical protein
MRSGARKPLDRFFGICYKHAPSLTILSFSQADQAAAENYFFARSPMVSAKLRVFVLLAISGILAVGLAEAQVVTSGGIVVPTLKQQLETGLLARTPDDQAFVAEVVALVDSGDLPISLVQSTFLWARRKKPPFAMQYFQRALRIRAAAEGIDL